MLPDAMQRQRNDIIEKLLVFLEHNSSLVCIEIVSFFNIFSGLVGETSWDLALIDQFYDLTEDLYKDILKEFYEKDKAKKVCPQTLNFGVSRAYMVRILCLVFFIL